MFNLGTVTMFDDPNSVHMPDVMDLARAIGPAAMTGVVYQMMAAPVDPITQKEYSMFSRTKSLSNGTIAAAWNASDVAGLPVPAQYLRGLTVGHQIQIDDEIVTVASVDRTANTISVHARGMCGTTAVAHTANTPFDVIGFAGRDADLRNVEGMSETTIVRSNYVQTVIEKIEWEKSAEIERYGIASSKQVLTLQMEAMNRVITKLSRSAIQGRKNRGTKDQPFASNGLIASLKDRGKDNECPIKVFNANNALLTEAMLHDALDMVFDYGSPDTIILSNQMARRFKAFIGAGDQGIPVVVHTDRTDTGVGRHVTHYDYNGVSLELKVDRDMPNNKIAVVTAQDLKKGWLKDDALAIKDEPQKSSREFAQSIQGSVGFIVENVGYNHILIENVALS